MPAITILTRFIHELPRLIPSRNTTAAPLPVIFEPLY
jgi:hypothetical protein